MWHVDEGSQTQQQEPGKRATPPVAATVPQFGRTNRRIFWSVFLASFLVLATLTTMVAQGTVAVASSLPTPFTIQGSRFDLSNISIIPNLSRASNHIPVAVVQADVTVHDLVLSKQFSVPFIGTVTIFLKASSATFKGLNIDVTNLAADHAQFNNMVIRTDIPPGLAVFASSSEQTNVTIKSPFLSVNTALFTNLSLFFTF